MRVFLYFFCVISSVALSGCVADRLAFWSKDDIQKHYIVTGLSNDENAHTYISSIITDSFSKQVIEDNETEHAISTLYKQENVRRDVLKAMHSLGYYDARVIYSDNEIGEYQIDAGDKIYIGFIIIEPTSYMDQLNDIGIAVGEPLKASKVIAAQSNIYNILQKENCAFALNVDHRVFIDPETKNAELYYDIEQGQEAIFGAVTFFGQTKVKDSYLQKLMTLKEGECFRHDKIAAMRQKILATGLFSSANIILSDNANNDGVIPIQVELKERAQRSLRAGVSYYTDEGLGAVFGWEHRNFLGAGEKLNADLTLSLLEQSLKATMITPYFLRNDQSLFMNAFVDREDTDAFEKLGIGAGVGVNKSFGKFSSGSLGIAFDITSVEEEGDADTEVFGLLSPYLSMTYNSRDNELDPHDGLLLNGSVEPFIDLFGTSLPFVKSKLTVQTYYQAHEKLVLAGSFSAGSIIGTSSDDIPINERFFAGGGSVRGFSYQEIGPFEQGEPVGGRSLIEGAAELRYKITKTFGGVAFIDAGQVDDNVSPSFDDLSVGAGLGVRYYTDFGPLRFDVGVPLSGRGSQDKNFQIYISIGQAF